MHSLIIWLLTVLMVLNCILLVFLILLQLPKKDAGAGIAFGGAATDALFGAGSGNVLTKITKYCASAFFVMALLLAVLGPPRTKATATSIEEVLGKQVPPASVPASPSGNLLQTPAKPQSTTPSTAPAAKPSAPTPSAAAPAAPAAPAPPAAAHSGSAIPAPASGK
jgi:protein translocase SecG subunit